MFKNSNSDGCPIKAYKIIKVIDNLTNKTLKDEENINLISLNNATGILSILKFNETLDYSLYLSASFDGTNWLSFDSKNTRNIRLLIQEDHKSLTVNSAPYFTEELREITLEVFPGKDKLLNFSLPGVSDNENDKIKISLSNLPDFLSFDEVSYQITVD